MERKKCVRKAQVIILFFHKKKKEMIVLEFNNDDHISLKKKIATHVCFVMKFHFMFYAYYKTIEWNERRSKTGTRRNLFGMKHETKSNI